MADELKGKKVAILAADGVEQIELERPRQAVEEAGAETELISPGEGEIQAVNSDINPSDKFPVDRAVGDVSPDDYDALLLPGGVANPDNLRQDQGAVKFVREFFKTGKPVGVIC
ncbi:MAG: protease, partial [Thermoleophilaceae bacterium]|nr:protease [Thermoleophilaceae bacterium]